LKLQDDLKQQRRLQNVKVIVQSRRWRTKFRSTIGNNCLGVRSSGIELETGCGDASLGLVHEERHTAERCTSLILAVEIRLDAAVEF